MLGSVVDHVAALAERGEIARRVVGRIVIEMRARDIHARDPHDRRDVRFGRSNPPPTAIAPLTPIAVPPSPVAQVEHSPSMRAPAMLALSLCPTEPDQPRQLGPVDGIKPAMFRHDRHDDSMSQS